MQDGAAGDAPGSDGAEPDIGFTLASESGPPNDTSVASVRADIDPDELAVDVAKQLAALGPPGWEHMVGVFALTVTTAQAYVEFSDGERMVRASPPAEIVESVRRQRALAAEHGPPWWRLIVRQDADGEAAVEYDYGTEPFPDGQRFRPEDYRADLDAYPRRRLPIWLAAYTSHGDRQTRSPQQATHDAELERATGIWSELADDEFPDLPVMWARWAVVAACFAAVGSPWGPRICPATALFEGARRSGSSLCLLPGERAVLSGGVWDAPTLDLAYNEAVELPQLYAGAPDWVTDAVLSPRAGAGLLSFSYWWEAGHWYRGDSPPAADCALAVPGVWTAATVTDIVANLIADHRGLPAPDDEIWAAAASLVASADAGLVDRPTVVRTFAGNADFDVPGAWFQLTVAGLAFSQPTPMPADLARARVHDYLRADRENVREYALSELAADRIEGGWTVSAPISAAADVAPVFRVGDDGVIEQTQPTTAFAPVPRPQLSIHPDSNGSPQQSEWG